MGRSVAKSLARRASNHFPARSAEVLLTGALRRPARAGPRTFPWESPGSKIFFDSVIPHTLSDPEEGEHAQLLRIRHD